MKTYPKMLEIIYAGDGFFEDETNQERIGINN